MARTIAILLAGLGWHGVALAQDAEAEPAEATAKKAAPEAAPEATKPEAEAEATEAEPEAAPEATKVAPEAAPEATKVEAAPAERPMVARPMSLPPPPPPEDELPIPTLTIDRIPPATSYEFAVQVSYGQVSYFRDQVPPWVGFGLRGAWGKNFGLHRLAGQVGFTTEGDMGIHTLLVLEPALAYDVVTPFGLQLGVSGGPALMYWSDNSTQVNERDIGVGPSVAARIGWSQTWTRVGRRLFVFAEPKLRVAGGSPDVLVAVAIGSGAGR